MNELIGLIGGLGLLLPLVAGLALIIFNSALAWAIVWNLL